MSAAHPGPESPADAASNGGTGQAHEEVDFAVVGGGIAGLYCCYQLRKHHKDKVISLYEASDRLGGRIETWRIDPKSYDHLRPGHDRDTSNRGELFTRMRQQDEDGRCCYDEDLEDVMIAEFGPMRIEPDHQPYLRHFLKDLGIKKSDGKVKKWSDLVPFSAYQSEPPAEPQFHLQGEEGEQDNLLDLLMLALRRIFETVTLLDGSTPREPWEVGPPPTLSRPNRKKYLEANFFWEKLRQDAFLHRRFWKRYMQEWINLLHDEHYDFIREQFCFLGTPLRDMGFWNVLASVLSHMATVKLRDWGSFYHLLPDNPSASEWIIFWLRAIRSSDSLESIRGGMDWMVKSAETSLFQHEPVIKRYEHPMKLRQVHEEKDHVKLIFEANGKNYIVLAHEVILALPKSPLQEIKFTADPPVAEDDQKKSPLQETELTANAPVAEDNQKKWNKAFSVILDSVAKVQLLKVFLVIHNPFWEDNRPANRYAYTIPAREVHYWKNRDKRTGLLMLYTDKPGTQFWSDYMVNDLRGDNLKTALGLEGEDPFLSPNRLQDEAMKWSWVDVAEGDDIRKHYGGDFEVMKFGNDRLLRTILHYIRENHAESFPDDHIVAAAIRDWGLKPYEAACHAWRPGSDPKKTIEYLAAFSIVGAANKRLHICGEAYSDYQGFIEGALRSAAKVLTGEPFHIKEKDLRGVGEVRKIGRARRVKPPVHS